MTDALKFSRLPRHVGLIPDGNRRWARDHGMPPSAGYAAGMLRGLRMLEDCQALGIEEVSVYGFTQDNTKRPVEQREAFAEACAEFVKYSDGTPIALQVIGDHTSHVFPEELKPYVDQRIGPGPLKVNLLVNYGWQWDLRRAIQSGEALTGGRTDFQDLLASRDVSRIDLVVRWGGMRRLSGFLPIQCVYADFFVVEQYWPDYEPEQFFEALRWYQSQDITLGG